MKTSVFSLTALSLFCMAGCSPLKTSPHDEKHQLELTLHEVQTNVDDLRHDINCFQTELQILDGRIKYYENALTSLKQQDLEKHQSKIDQLNTQIQLLEKKVAAQEKTQQTELHRVGKLTDHANETTAALTQFKSRLQEIEGDLSIVSKLKGNLESIARNLKPHSEATKSYKVGSGDSLEKIARLHKTTVERIKKLNSLDNDLIVVGQELKIPTE